MLVKDCMTRHPIMISPKVLAVEAQKIMTENAIRHLPVVGDGKRLKGLITRERLAIKPDALGSLNMWEITRYVSNLTVEKVMLKAQSVYTITADKTVERAARLLADNKIGCLPVLDEDGAVVGIITEVDLLRSYQEMLGLPMDGVRVTIRMPNQPGEFAKLMRVLGEQGWGIMGIGTFPAPRREGFYDAVIKIPGTTSEAVKAVLSKIEDQEVIDIRDIV